MILFVNDYFAGLHSAAAQCIVCKKKLIEHDKLQLRKCCNLEAS